MTKRNRKAARHPKITGTWVVLLMVFMAELLFYTWCRVQCVKVGYEITAAASRQAHLARLQNSLEIELARLKSPKRIARIAGSRLGLKMPNAEQTVVIP